MAHRAAQGREDDDLTLTLTKVHRAVPARRAQAGTRGVALDRLVQQWCDAHGGGHGRLRRALMERDRAAAGGGATLTRNRTLTLALTHNPDPNP